MKAKKRPESALVVIYNDLDQVLVMQRQDDPTFWQSVTGSMELGETPRDTAIREVFEETGIDVAKDALLFHDHKTVSEYVIRPLWRHRYEEGVTVNREHLFSLKVKSGQSVVLTEHLDYRWVSKAEAIEIMWSDSNAKGVQVSVPDCTNV